jgi:hypothetical protein
MAIAGGFALRVLIPHEMDPSIFLALGEDAPIQTEYARELLGEVILRENLGHDGKYFFAQANDPWFLEPHRHAAAIDRPIYRGQRMMYPTIAGGFGLFPPTVVVWSMLVTNVIGLGIGAMLAARLAERWGSSPWLGLAVPLNIGLIFELDIGGGGVVAYAFCLGAVLALVDRRYSMAAGLLAGAALAREVMLAFAAGLFVLNWITERRRRWQLLALPVAGIAAWHVYTRYRLTGVNGEGGGAPIFDIPLAGLWRALGYWIRDPGDLLFNAALLAVVVAFTIRAFRSRQPLAWGALPFVALATALSVYVWREPVDLARALAPVFTAYVFLLFVKEREHVHDDADSDVGSPDQLGAS